MKNPRALSPARDVRVIGNRVPRPRITGQISSSENLTIIERKCTCCARPWFDDRDTVTQQGATCHLCTKDFIELGEYC